MVLLRPYTNAYQTSASRSLKSAFEDDPIVRVFIPEQELYDREGAETFGRYANVFYRSFRLAEIICDEQLTNEDNVISFGMWEPGQTPLFAYFHFLSFFLWYMWRLGFNKGSCLISFILSCETKRHEYAPTALHLQLMNTSPLYQRQGHGSTLLKYGLERADTLKLPCYLECTKEKNIHFYKQHGFQIVEEYYPFESNKDVEGKGPPVYLMLRKAIESGDDKNLV